MRGILITLLLLQTIATAARVDKHTPIYLSPSLLYGTAVGAFHVNNNNNFYYGQGKGGWGGTVHFAMPVLKNIYWGFNYRAFYTKPNTTKVASQAYELFDAPNYFTTVDESSVEEFLTMHHFAPEIGYLIRTRVVDIKPSIEMGLLLMGRTDQLLSLERKKYKSNYKEEVKVMAKDQLNTAMYWGIGLRLYKEVNRRMDVMAGMHYTVAGVNVGYKTETTAFTGEKSTSAITTFTQPYRSLQFQLGISFRVWDSK